MDSKKLIIITVVVVILFAGVVAFWYWQKRSGPGTSSQLLTPTVKELSLAEVKGSLGGQIFEQTQNPLKGKLPPTNPFEKTETNPLKGVYQNPF